MLKEDIQNYFKEKCSVRDNAICLGNEQLSREDFLQIKKLLVSRGGRWKGGKISGFLFDSDPTGIYESICSGDMENKKNVYQFFQTPDDIADRMVERLWIQDCDVSWIQDYDVRVLEPSAGRGSLIEALHRKFPTIVVDAYEINPDCYYALENLQNVILHKSDFLEIADEEVYDFIIANPPFAKNSDIKHTMKMFSVLKSGGTMCVIVSSHALEAREKEVSEFKEWLYLKNPLVEELESGTFKSAGTDVRTYMLTINK